MLTSISISRFCQTQLSYDTIVQGNKKPLFINQIWKNYFERSDAPQVSHVLHFGGMPNMLNDRLLFEGLPDII